jgi:complement component 1 Q subcomponent-binding protein, mitochondrial
VCAVNAGPLFQELDADLQQEFAAYLEAKGITADLCQYLCRLVYDKEQQEYLRWMRKVLKFTEK